MSQHFYLVSVHAVEASQLSSDNVKDVVKIKN